MPSPRARPRLLLHVCCGPCATVAVERLVERYQVTLLWYNPNVEPQEEYQRRLHAARVVARHYGLTLREAEPDREAWRAATAPLAAEPEGGRRCRVCFAHRLQRAAQLAAAEGYDCFTTTLSVGPQKDWETLWQVGEEQAQQAGMAFLAVKLREREGYARSAQLSRELGLYRQRYCGCSYAAR